MGVIVFNQRVKHGRLDFHPTIPYGFEDPDAAPYFKACGWAEDSSAEPLCGAGQRRRAWSRGGRTGSGIRSCGCGQ